MSAEAPTFNQITEQQRNIGKPNEVPATILVPRSDGSIDTAYVYNNSDRAYLEPALSDETPYKDINSPEATSDAVQEELARQIGGKALRGDEAPTPLVAETPSHYEMSPGDHYEAAHANRRSYEASTGKSFGAETHSETEARKRLERSMADKHDLARRREQMGLKD